MRLRYGCNPHQSAEANAIKANGPVKLLHGKPSLINLLDALNSWQLVRELRAALDAPAAASFKHLTWVQRPVRPFPQPARERIGNECAVKKRIQFSIERVMKQSVSHACLVNVARLGVGNLKMLIWSVSIDVIAQIAMKR